MAKFASDMTEWDEISDMTEWDEMWLSSHQT